MEQNEYLKVVRKTSFIGAFMIQYLSRIIIVYLLSKGVAPWIAVSIPIVIEFGRVLSRIIEPISKISLKINYKTYYYIYIIIFTILSILISQCTTLYTIYPLTLILGLAYGLWAACLNKLNTSNSNYQSFCLYEDEKFNMLGSTAGLILSQIVYDINPTLYIISFILVAVISIITCLKIPNIKVEEDDMLSYEKTEEIPKKQKQKLFVLILLFGTLIGIMNIVYNSLEAIPPLITEKAGYLSSIYTFVEFVALLLLSGHVIEKIKGKGKLLLSETVIAIIYAILLTLAGIFQNYQSLIFIFILYGISSPLADPIWSSLMSEYSQKNRRYFIYINKIYFMIRAIILIITWVIIKVIITSGLHGFAILGIISIISLIAIYLITEWYTKKYLKKTI